MNKVDRIIDKAAGRDPGTQATRGPKFRRLSVPHSARRGTNDIYYDSGEKGLVVFKAEAEPLETSGFRLLLQYVAAQPALHSS